MCSCGGNTGVDIIPKVKLNVDISSRDDTRGTGGRLTVVDVGGVERGALRGPVARHGGDGFAPC